jgi:hypothetical protein
VFFVGDEVCAIDTKGFVRVLVHDCSLWSAAFVRGTLYAGTLSGVVEIDTKTGAITDVLSDVGAVTHNHSLVVSAGRAAFVCGGNVFVLEGDKFRALSLERQMGRANA